MNDFLVNFEREAFLALNGSSFAYLDRVMWLVSGKVIWLPVVCLILYYLIQKKSWREWLPVLLSIALVVLLCDQFASSVCKPIFMRLRPTHNPLIMNQVDTVNGYLGGKYGFISSHAANAFGFAMLMTLIFKNRIFTWSIMFWAIIDSYSRIYLGVHFITDVLAGIPVGLLFGYLVYKLYFYVVAKKFTTLFRPSSYGTKEIFPIIYGLLATFFVILVFNGPIISFFREIVMNRPL